MNALHPATSRRDELRRKESQVVATFHSRFAPAIKQRVHDVCVVCPPEKHVRSALVHRCAVELGGRAVRVSAAGSRESNWSPGDVRGATEGDTGSDHDVGFRAVLLLLSAGETELGLCLGGFVSAGGGVFHVPREVGIAWLDENTASQILEGRFVASMCMNSLVVGEPCE